MDERIARREFLARGGAAVGALAAPWVFPGSLRGMVAPSERVALGFIGPGSRGTELVWEFAGRADVEPLAVCDVRKDQREKVHGIVDQIAGARRGRGSYGGSRSYRDFREVLARPDIDGVVIAAPEHWRPLMCVLAARAGKDIYSEKPFALTIREGQAMVDAVRRYGRIFQHGTQRRSNNESGLRDSCELVRNGRIGKVTHAVVTVGPSPRPDFPDYASHRPEPDRETFDWDLWLGPAPWRPYPGSPGVQGWQGRSDFGLSSIGNWGSHVLDMAQWALGKDAEGPVEVLPPTAEEPRLAIRYADGVRILCPRTPGDSSQVAVFGTEGVKSIFGNPRVEERYDRTPLRPGEERLYRPEGNDHTGNFIRSIRDRKKTICDEEVAFRSGSLCMLISIGDRLGRPLRYDPVKGEFPGDPEANRLLGRPMRSPWRMV